jgi:2-methylcitrate dehydratase PrpD
MPTMVTDESSTRTSEREAPPATRLLAQFAVETRFEDLPADLIARLRTDALDGIAVGVFGSTLPWISLATEYWEELGGRPESSVWGRRSKLPAIMATLANSHAQNAFEYDDTYVWSGLGTHQGNNVTPAAVAIAEMLGDASGRDFMVALAVGHEVGVRIMKALKVKRAGHNHTAITSTFGAAATAGKLLGLSVEQMNWALGSAGSYVGGLLTIPPSSMVKRMVNGRAAQGGVMGAVLAKRGFTGIENVLEAKQGGFFGLLSNETDYGTLLDDLGTVWLSTNVHTKRFPMCTSIHAPLEATCQVVRDAKFSPSDVARIVVRTTTGAQSNTVGFWPDTISSAQLSLAFGVAVAVQNGEVLPREVTMEKLADPAFVALVKAVEPVKDPELDAIWKGVGGPARVEIHLKDGRVLRSDLVLEATRMTDAEIEAKARDAMSDVIGAEKTMRMIEFFRDIEKRPSIGPLFPLLTR